MTEETKSVDPNDELLNHNYSRLRYSSVHGYYTRERGTIPKDKLTLTWFQDRRLVVTPQWDREAKDFFIKITPEKGKKPVRLWLWQACEKYEVYWVPNKGKWGRSPVITDIENI